MKARLAAFLLALALWEAGARAALFALERLRGLEYRPVEVSLSQEQRRIVREVVLQPKSRHTVYDPDLGWTARPGQTHGVYRVNAQGLRAEREYPAFPPPGRLRIAAFGDSFTHGNDVTNKQSWTERMGTRQPSVEVLNFGIGGYGLDQAFLRYRGAGADFHPAIVFIGFTSEDILRNMNVFRPFLFPSSGMPFTKPRFALAGNDLRLVANPMRKLEDYQGLLADEEATLRRIGADDVFYRANCHPGPLDRLGTVRLLKLARAALTLRLYGGEPYEGARLNARTEGFELTVRLFRAFARAVSADGAKPVILYLPYAEEIEQVRDGGINPYSPLVERLKSEGLCVVDLMDAFAAGERQPPVEALFGAERHYSPLGNDIVAGYLLDWLARHRKAGAADACLGERRAP